MTKELLKEFTKRMTVGAISASVISAIAIGLGFFISRVLYIPTDGTYLDALSLGFATLMLVAASVIVFTLVGTFIMVLLGLDNES